MGEFVAARRHHPDAARRPDGDELVTGRLSSQRAQSLVEFALIAPLLLLLLMVILDFGRGFFFYTQMSAGAREGGRQAVLYLNRGSNTAPGACSSPCQVPGVVPQLQVLNSFGFPVVYSDSTAANSPPSYATCTGGSSTTPATCTLNSTANVNQVYVLVYEIGPSSPSNPYWPCPSCGPVRVGVNGTTPNHNSVVVDLKMRFQPVTLGFAGLPWTIDFDAQSVQRMEW
jgi:Flp pilus assembly protein TadG